MTDAASDLDDCYLKDYPEVITYQAQIGPIIGIHTSPGLLAWVWRETAETRQQNRRKNKCLITYLAANLR